MLAEEYYTFKNTLNSRGIIFSFIGYVSEAVLFSLGEALKQKMAIDEADANITKKVFSVFVEQVQNIIRYSDERVSGQSDKPPAQKIELSSGVIAVGSEGSRFFVVCGNVIAEHEVPRLQERLNHLSGLDKDAIKAYYRTKLREPAEEESKGATIGLIEIARRSSEPLEYDFHSLPGGKSFFCLKAYI